MVLPSSFFIILQPQECLSSHTADDQGQAHVCTFAARQRACLANEVAVNFLTPHLTPLPTCLPVMLWHHSWHLQMHFTTNSKRNAWKSSVDCSSPYVPPGQCLSSTHEAKDFNISQQQQQMVERGKSQGKIRTSFKCALCSVLTKKFQVKYLKLFMRVAAMPIIVFLLLCSINDSNWSQTVK